MKTILSCSTPDGRIACELMMENNYGSEVYVTRVYESINNIDYCETHRSYPVGKLHKAKTIYHQYCNRWLRNKK